MPTTPWCQLRIGQQHRPLLGGPVQPLHTLPEDLALNGLPLPVQGAQLLGQLLPRSRSLVRRSSTAIWARPIRPEALIRGARV